MFKVDISTSIVLCFVFSMLPVLAAWIWHELTHRQRPLEIEKKTALRCTICLHTFIASTESKAQRCPNCDSWVQITSRFTP